MPSGWSLDPDGNVGARWMATALKPTHRDLGGKRGNSGYRTRLTDLLAPSCGSKIGPKLLRIAFLPKDKDEIEALVRGLFKAKIRETMMPKPP
jgi:hypothetical protein